MSELPPWMRADADEHIRKSMNNYPELWITAARYAATGMTSPDRLALIMEATEIIQTKSVPEWLRAVETFDASDLKRGGKNRSTNPDRPARAFYLAEAICRLLQIVGASDSLEVDLRTLLGSSLPHEAKRRADMQGALIEYPELSNRQVAGKIRYDPSLLGEELASGLLRRIPKM